MMKVFVLFDIKNSRLGNMGIRLALEARPTPPSQLLQGKKHFDDCLPAASTLISKLGGEIYEIYEIYLSTTHYYQR
ncbi:hypothetical protein ACN42_g2499 [Penicillium freii]|uniref:Uncharacterized protein n=1 Tax=Penicillium freii TaxID=48697 RepID=A0A117NQU1_PENFR|nr:hypothetical protein ACN42_g2499 [Penicillium freii]